MTNHEQHRKAELNPARELERHLGGLQTTEREIKEFRMRTRIGRAGMSENIALGIHANNSARHGFASAAERFSETIDERRNPTKKMYADMFSHVPSYIDAKKILDSEDRRQLHRDTDAKLQVAGFNHFLQSTIDTNQTLQPQTITALIRSTAMRYGYGTEIINNLVREANESLYAMKHELAFEATLYYLPEGYEILETDSGDDIHGADRRVRCPNGTIVSIDVKASQEGVNLTLAKRMTKRKLLGMDTNLPQNQLVMFSGFTSEDFDSQNPWRPKPEAVERVYPQVEAALRTAAGIEAPSMPQGVK